MRINEFYMRVLIVLCLLLPGPAKAETFPLPLNGDTVIGQVRQIAIGTAVFGGMISATLLAIFFVPLFFALVFKARGAGQNAEIAPG